MRLQFFAFGSLNSHSVTSEDISSTIAMEKRKKIKRLSFRFLPLQNDDFVSILRAATNLLSISLRCCPCIGTEGIRSLGVLCPNLQDADFGKCMRVGDNALEAYATAYCEAFPNTPPRLRSLNLEGCNGTESILGTEDFVAGVTDSGLISFLSTFGCVLRIIIIARCIGVSDTSIDSICIHCKVLSGLDMSYCINVSSKCLTQIQKHHPSARIKLPTGEAI